jgi:hypothetical protein
LQGLIEQVIRAGEAWMVGIHSRGRNAGQAQRSGSAFDFAGQRMRRVSVLMPFTA